MKTWAVAMVWLVAGEEKMRTDTGVEYTLLDRIRGNGIDRREYRLLRLANQMEVLIGRDAQYDKSIVVLDVRVGFRQETPKRRGTMHLYEHILNTDRFKAHIAKRMGYTNAETSYEHTNYHFTVASKALNKTLKLFYNTLKRPKFNIKRLQVDVEVVDQEFRDELQNDAYRLEKVSRITGNQHHSHTSYFGGNNATLSSISYSDLQVSLQRIYNSQYSSHRMRLVVIGSAPFNHQIETIVNNFSYIPKTSMDDNHEGDPFKEEPQTIKITATTVKDQNTLLMQFHLQPLHAFLKSKSAEYIAYMLSQSNDGAILAVLKKRGWAFDLKCGVVSSYQEFSLFNIEIALTPQGLLSTQPVAETVLQAIELIKYKGIKLSYFDEMSLMLQRRQESILQDHPLDHAIEVSRQMHYHKVHQILDFESEIEFQPENITSLLEQMSLKNLRVMVSYKSAPTDKVEPVYGTGYSISYLALRNAATLGIVNDLKLPTHNPFLSEGNEVIDYDLPKICNITFQTPHRIIIDRSGEMWTMPANSSKSIFFMFFALPQQITLEEFVKVELFSRIKFESLGEMNYHLSKAGNYYSVEPRPDGLEFKIFAFNKNIGLIVDKILKTMFDPRVGRDEYDMFKYSEVKRLENSLLDKPVKQAQVKLEYALGKRKWNTNELIQATKAIDFRQLENYSGNPYVNGSLLFYLHGSLGSNEMKELFGKAIPHLKGSFPYEPPSGLYRLPKEFVADSSFVHRFMLADEKETNSGLAFYLHTFDRNTPCTESITRITHYLMKDAFLRKVRFDENLGYDHNIDILEGPLGGGLLVTIQSRKDPSHVELSVEKILTELNKTLYSLSDAEFKNNVNLFISLSTTRDRQDVEASEYWDQISRGYKPTDRASIMRRNYGRIQRAMVTSFLEKYIIFSASHRRKLSIHAASQTIDPNYNGDLTWQGTPISDLTQWRLP